MRAARAPRLAYRTWTFPCSTIRFGVKEFPNNRSIMVTALRITLAPAAQQDTGLVTINLGVARAGIKKY